MMVLVEEVVEYCVYGWFGRQCVDIQCYQFGYDLFGVFVQYGDEQFFFGIVVVIDQLFGDFCFVGKFFYVYVGEVFVSEFQVCSFDQVVECVVFFGFVLFGRVYFFFFIMVMVDVFCLILGKMNWVVEKRQFVSILDWCF